MLRLGAPLPTTTRKKILSSSFSESNFLRAFRAPKPLCIRVEAVLYANSRAFGQGYPGGKIFKYNLVLRRGKRGKIRKRRVNQAKISCSCSLFSPLFLVDSTKNKGVPFWPGPKNKVFRYSSPKGEERELLELSSL